MLNQMLINQEHKAYVSQIKAVIVAIKADIKLAVRGREPYCVRARPMDKHIRQYFRYHGIEFENEVIRSHMLVMNREQMPHRKITGVVRFTFTGSTYPIIAKEIKDKPNGKSTVETNNKQ